MTALKYFMQSLGITENSKFEITDTDGSPKIIHVSEVYEQAKQLEKQQIIQAHEDAYMDCGFEYSASDCANNYYKERYDKV